MSVRPTAGDLEILVVTAPGCPACRAMVADLDGLHVPDGVSLVRVDAVADPKQAKQLSIRATPTFVARRNGVELWRTSGRRSAGELAAMVASPEAPVGSSLDARLRVPAGTLLIAAGLVASSWPLVIAGVTVAAWGVATCRTRG